MLLQLVHCELLVEVQVTPEAQLLTAVQLAHWRLLVPMQAWLSYCPATQAAQVEQVSAVPSTR